MTASAFVGRTEALRSAAAGPPQGGTRPLLQDGELDDRKRLARGRP